MKCPYCGSIKLEETANFDEFACKLCNCEFRNENPGYKTFEEGSYSRFCENVCDSILNESSGNITNVVNAISKEAKLAGIEYIDIPIERLQELYEAVKNESDLGIRDAFDLEFIKNGIDNFTMLGESIISRSDLEINMERFIFLKENQLATVSVKPLGPVGGGKKKEVVAGAVEEEITPEVNIVDDETIEAIADDSLDELKSMYSDSPEGTFDFEIQHIIEVAKKYWPEIETYSPETLGKLKTLLDRKANAGSTQDFTETAPIEETPNYSGDTELSHLSSIGSDEDPNSPEAQGIEGDSEFYDDKIGGVSDFASDIKEPKNPIDIDSAITIIKSEGLQDDLEIYKRLLELVGNISGEEADKVLDTVRGTSVGVQEDSLTGSGIGDGTNDIGTSPEETKLHENTEVSWDSFAQSQGKKWPSVDELEQAGKIYDKKVRKIAELVYSDIKNGKIPEERQKAHIKSAAEHVNIEYTDNLFDDVMDLIQEWTADAGFADRYGDIDESKLMEAVEHIISKATNVEELRDL